MTNTLSGKIHSSGNFTNLAGKNYNWPGNGGSSNGNSIITLKVKKIKDRVLQNYLIPLFTKQWNVLKENIFFIDEMLNKINYYYDIYKLNELLVYIELLKVLKILIENHKLLENYDGSVSGKRDPNEVMSMVFKTSMIRLLPEFEIYDSILGKPSRELNEKYDEKIINHIRLLLGQDDITYHKIKEYIISKTKGV